MNDPDSSLCGLPPITDDDRAFLSYNPNTEDLVAWIRAYAESAIKRLHTPASASDPTKVICPNCCHEFRAIPQDVQAQLTELNAPGKR